MRSVRTVPLFAVLMLVSACGGGRESPFEPTESAQPFMDCNTVLVISLGQTVNGSLGPGDCQLDDESFVDFYELRLSTARNVTITMNSASLDAFLLLFNRTSMFPIALDDDGGGGTNARLVIQLAAGTYVIGANSFMGGETGPYELRVN
jgi:hypothetical protein